MAQIRLFVGVRMLATAALMAAAPAQATPKVILISLDGAEPSRIRHYLNLGVLPQDRGLGFLRQKGVMADRNVTVTPSLTAVSHIAIATGSTAARNDIPANTFKLVASPLNRTISGFAAPIGGYSIDGPMESPDPSAEPLWVALRNAGKKVVAPTILRLLGVQPADTVEGRPIRLSEHD